MSKLSQKLQQNQKLNPRQIIEANLMQLNLGNLEKRILEEVESNPTLDIIENEEVDENQEEPSGSDFNWDELISNPEDYNISSDTSKKQFEINSSEPDLSEDFMSQLNALNFSDKELESAEYIIGNLDDRGYLAIEPIVISDKMGLSEQKILSLINEIKKLDPPGIGSRNLQECLLSQLTVLYPNEKLAIQIVESFFDELKNHNYIKIIDGLKCEKNEFIKV